MPLRKCCSTFHANRISATSISELTHESEKFSLYIMSYCTCVWLSPCQSRSVTINGCSQCHVGRVGRDNEATTTTKKTHFNCDVYQID